MEGSNPTGAKTIFLSPKIHLNNFIFLDLLNFKTIFFLAFYGLEKDILLKGLTHLEKQGKAVLIDIDGEKGGVKFI